MIGSDFPPSPKEGSWLAVCVGVLGSDHPVPLWELFPYTTERGRAAVEYDDDAWVVVAAYYYSQRESRWLLIELAVTSDDLLRLRQQDIVLLTPDLKPVPVASHQAVSQDVQRTLPLLQNASLTRHLDRRLGDFFPGRRREHFHWFALTAFEGTVSNDFDVDVLPLVSDIRSNRLFVSTHRGHEIPPSPEVLPDEIARPPSEVPGDVDRASPTGAWEAGTYELIVQGPGEAQAVLPIDLD